ncbi:protein kinase [Sorangium sp. So ce1036]|uniref:serine/threonine-protein kinase n=1 Tax=Sorangium sp. So ce1036 TaxID=3133328 RepID=UPI003F0C7EC0
MFPTEPAPGTIGAYKILRRLSGSGPTSVYLGRLDGPLGFRRVSELKLVPNTAEGDPRFGDELAREASICASLNHPAIVRMFDFFEHDGKLVLVLEHVEGVNLNRLLQHLSSRQQKLADAAVYYVVHCLAGALAHAHGATDEHGSPTPVIHRNLHPENVVIGWDGQVRLTGFGLGKILGRTPDTIAGVVKGAPGFMAPEQVRAERVTTKADIYGLGLLLWSLLSGRRPPADGTRPPSISSIRPEIPRPIAALLDTALSPSPDNRKLTCQDIEQTLAKVSRPERGKSELVTRVQSAHATIELEDADPEEDRRPTIPVKGKGGQTARPAADAARWLAKDRLARDGSPAPPRPGGPLAQTAPPTAAAAEALAGSARRDGPGRTAAPGPDPITIPVPANPAPPLPGDPKGEAARGAGANGGGLRGGGSNGGGSRGDGAKGEARRPGLPDRETFGRLFEASRRAAERDAEAEEALAGGMATLPDEADPVLEDGSSTLPGAAPSLAPLGVSPSGIPEAIRFGPPPALPADLAPVFFGPAAAPASSPESSVTPSGVEVPVAPPGLPPPGLPPPGMALPVGSVGLTPTGGVSQPGAAGLTGASAAASSGVLGASLRRGWASLRRGWASLCERWPVLRRGWASLQRGWASLRRGWASLHERWPALRRGGPMLRRGGELLREGWASLRQGWASLRRRWPLPRWQVPRSLSPIGTIAVSAVTATIVAVLWIYIARREAPVVITTAPVDATPELESDATAALPPSEQPSEERSPGSQAPAVKASAARDAEAKEAAAREAAAKEAAAREAAAKEAAAKEAAAKEAAAKEAAAKEAAEKEAAAKEAAEKEAAAKEAAEKEAAAKEAAEKEAAAKEAAEKEAAAKEAAAKEAVENEARKVPDLATLPKGHGVLTVGFPETGGVYVNGKHAGPVNEPLVVRCGRFFVRVGKPGETKYPEWLSAGVTALVPCQNTTQVDIRPNSAARAKKR